MLFKNAEPLGTVLGRAPPPTCECGSHRGWSGDAPAFILSRGLNSQKGISDWTLQCGLNLQRFLPRACRELKAVVTYPWECDFHMGIQGYGWCWSLVAFRVRDLISCGCSEAVASHAHPLEKPSVQNKSSDYGDFQEQAFRGFPFSPHQIFDITPALTLQTICLFFKMLSTLWQWISWIPFSAGGTVLEEKGHGKFPWNLWVPAGMGVGQSLSHPQD